MAGLGRSEVIALIAEWRAVRQQQLRTAQTG